MKPLAILHVDQFHSWAGQSRRIFSLCLEQRALGHRVTVAVPPDSPLFTRCAEAGIQVWGGCRFPPGVSPLHLLEVARLRRFLQAGRFDIVDAHADVWPLALALRGTRSVLVRSRHNSRPTPPHLLNRWLHGRHVRHVNCNAAKAARQLVESGLLPAAAVSAIPSAIDLARFDPDLPGGPVRATLGLPPTGPCLMVVARLDGHKGHHLLLQAAPEVLRRHPEAFITFVGEGPAARTLADLALGLGIAHRVHFLGFREDVPRVLAAADLCLLPSEAEGTPTCLVEAQAMRVPVIATRVDGVPDVMHEGETGLLVDYGDVPALTAAILRLLDDPALARRMGEAGRRLVEENFTLRRMAERTLAAYHTALAAAGVPDAQEP